MVGTPSGDANLVKVPRSRLLNESIKMANLTSDSSTCVVGSGYMGGGIAQVLALAGHPVIVADVDADTAEKSRERITYQTANFEALRLLPQGAASKVACNLTAAESIKAAVAEAQYITEAVPEDREIKRSTLQVIAGAARDDAIIGTNTSAIPVEELAQDLRLPERFLGVHWMNPAPFIPCVELIASSYTSPETLRAAESLICSLGKETVRVADTPGFVANRLQFALYKEAMSIVEEGAADPNQVDSVVRNSFGFRLALFGPFAIGDMAGLDVYKAAYETLEAEYGDRFAAPNLLKELVSQGNLGIKSGRGLLDIPTDERTRQNLLDYRDSAYGRLAGLRAELGRAPGLGC